MQRQKYIVSASALLTGKFLRVEQKTLPFYRKVSRLPNKYFLIPVWTVWYLSGQSAFCLGSLETIWTLWKLLGQSGICPDSLEFVRTVWKLSGQPENCPDSLETVRTVWKHSVQSGTCPESLKLSGQSENCSCQTYLKTLKFRTFFLTRAAPYFFSDGTFFLTRAALLLTFFLIYI